MPGDDEEDDDEIDWPYVRRMRKTVPIKKVTLASLVRILLARGVADKGENEYVM